MIVHLEPNESPINLFKPDFDKYSSAKYIHHFYQESLQPGDCLYIPAYYFFQVSGLANEQPQKGDYKSSAITVSFHYRPHSKLLMAFYDAIEKGILT